MQLRSQRQRSTPPPQATRAEDTLWACDLRDGRGLGDGLYNDGRNLRCPEGRPETRKGVSKPGWANRITPGSDLIQSLGTPYGAGVFRDPNGTIDWQILAADGYAWRTRPYNQNVSIPLPTGVRLLSRCTFVQAFNKLFCFRGRYVAPLRMTSFDDGFEDLLDHWNSSTTHAQGTEVFYGPFLEVSTPVALGAGELTSASTTATVTHADHGLATGDSITIYGATQTEYNGTYTITVTGTGTFTYTFAGSGTTPATGTIYYVKSGLTRSGNTATVTTVTPHGYVTGADITISGASASEYNGRFNITVLDAYTFTYFVTGAPATPDVGTVRCSNMSYAYESLGTLYTLTSITRVGTTATATKAAHGFSNGQTVVIAGATPSGYNGTYLISNVTTDTFDYTMALDPGSSASPAGTVRNNLTLAGQSPDTAATSWQRIYDILPNADTALYTNNRLLVPTAYTPGTTGYNSADVTYTKVDFLVATDIQDEIHFDFTNEFRINAGSSDEIVDLAKWSEDAVIVWKGKSWGVLTGVALDLTDVALDMRSRSYGLTARGAWAEAGDNIVFVADRRGFVNIKQSESGKLIGVDVPLSAPIQKLIDRIDWTEASAIRLANWNSQLYAAVPMNLPRRAADNLCAGLEWTLQGDPEDSHLLSYATVTGLVEGQSYRLTWGEATLMATSGVSAGGFYPEGEIVYPPEGEDYYGGNQVASPYEFTATQNSMLLFAPGFTSGAVQARLETMRTQYVVLVYSFVSAQMLGDVRQGWLPMDTGSGLDVLEWFKQPLDGEERLFFLSTAGWVNLMEESDRGDMIAGDNDQGLGWEELDTRMRFRPQGAQLERLQTPRGAHLALETFNPSYSITAHFEGVNKKTVLCSAETKSAVNYTRPWDATPWDPSNVNDDHDTPYREDYRVTIPHPLADLLAGMTYDVVGPIYRKDITALLVSGRTYEVTLGANESGLASQDLTIQLAASGAFTYAGQDPVYLVGGLVSGGGATITAQLQPRGFQFGSGVDLHRFQESLHHFRMSGRQGRSVALELVNTQGQIRWQGILTQSQPGRQRQGVQQ